MAKAPDDKALRLMMGDFFRQLDELLEDHANRSGNSSDKKSTKSNNQSNKGKSDSTLSGLGKDVQKSVEKGSAKGFLGGLIRLNIYISKQLVKLLIKSFAYVVGVFANMIEGVITTAAVFLKDRIGGALKEVFGMFSDVTDFFSNPIGAIMKLAGEYSDIHRSIYDATGMLNKATNQMLASSQQLVGQFSGLGVTLKGAAESVSAVANAFGNMDYFTQKTAESVVLMNRTLGLANDEAAGLLKTFQFAGGMTDEAASNLAFAGKEMSKMMGVAPKKVMADIAKNSGVMYTYFKGNAKEMMKTAVLVNRLGLTMDKIAGTISKLMDWDASIEDELNASVLLGKNIDLSRARQAAYNNDMATMTSEIIKQAGSVSEFNNLKFMQKEAYAKAVGMEVQQLTEVLNQSDKLTGTLKTQNKEKTAGIAAANDMLNKTKEMNAEQAKTSAVTDAQITAMESFKSIFEPIKVVMMQIANSLLPAITGIVNSLMPIVTGTLIPLINKFLPMFLALVDQVAKLVAVALPPLINLFAGVVEKMMPIISRFIDFLIPFIDKLMPIVNLIIDSAMTIIEPLANFVMNLANILMPIITELMSALKPIFDTLVTVFMQLINDLVKSGILQQLTGVVIQIIKGLQPLFVLFTDIIKMLMPIVMDVVQILINSFKPLIDIFVKDVIPYVMAMYKQTIEPLIKQFLPPIMNIIKVLLPFLITIMSKLMVFGNMLSNVFMKVFGVILAPILQTVIWIIEGIMNLLSWIPGLSDLSINSTMNMETVGGLGSTMGSMVGNIGNDFGAIGTMVGRDVLPQYANGGIVTKPHVGIVGEAGNEAIIPLDKYNNGDAFNTKTMANKLDKIIELLSIERPIDVNLDGKKVGEGVSRVAYLPGRG